MFHTRKTKGTVRMNETIQSIVDAPCVRAVDTSGFDRPRRPTARQPPNHTYRRPSCSRATAIDFSGPQPPTQTRAASKKHQQQHRRKTLVLHDTAGFQASHTNTNGISRKGTNSQKINV
mmetsp:Transcript_22560/g.47758  ORF Transcript_22560/g.47758 Transcript_22560/m.47758 type:complete len:119 (-) Transcript_22560:557-913(-)